MTVKGLLPRKGHGIWKLSAALFAVAGAAAVAYFSLPSTRAEARPPLGRKWPASARVSINDVDHSTFDSLLKKYVDGDGYVNYSAWKESKADRRTLGSYLAALSRADRRKPADREARLAFWINAYNAVTIEGILREYPTSSIREHTSRLGGYNIWKHLPLQVGRKEYSLEEIEHKILRKMGEPRIHFAIVCASVGCPRLRNEAYLPDRLDEQLTANARDFFSRSKNFRVDVRNRTIYLSSILDWFAGDFGASQAERMSYLEPYLPENLQQVATNPRFRVKYLDYDWSLNDQARRRTASRR